MDAIWHKIKADIISRPLISALIIVTVVTSSALLTLALATLMNATAPYDKAFEALNGAHVWLYFDRENVQRRDVERIEALAGVVESTGLRYYALGRVRIRDNQVWVSLRAIPLETLTVNRLLVQEGRDLAPGRNELLASKDLDDLYGLSVGEVIGIAQADGREVGLPVIGLAYNPMWDVYRNEQPPYIYLSEHTLRDLFPDDSAWGWSLGLRLVNPDAVDEMVALVEQTIGADALEGHTDWRDVRDTATFDVRLNFIFLGAFGFFAILATMLVIASSISSIVLSQFRQIGILKAVGFTQAQVLWLYLGQYLLLSLAGSPLGLLIGLAVSPLPLRSAAVSLSTTFRPPFNFLLVALVFSLVPGVVTLATVGTAYRGAQANIVRSIAVGAEAPRKRASWGARLAARLDLPLVLVLGMNDVFARPFRSLLTGLNLTLGVIGIVFGLTLNATLDTYRTEPSLLGIPYDALVTREQTSDSKARHVLSTAPGVEAFYGERLLTDVETPEGQTFQVRAVEGDLDAFPFLIPQGRLFRPNTDEAVAGRGLLDWLGLQVGDDLTVVFEGRVNRPVTWRIVGQYTEPANRGQMLMVSLPAAARLVKHVEPNTYYLKLSPDCDTAQLKRHLQPKPDADLSVKIVAEAIPDGVVYLQLAIFGLSVILIGIALINVFNTSLLAMREKLRMVGILKSVGMTPAQVVAMANSAAGFLGFLAALSGAPIGLLLTAGLLNTLSASYGFGVVRVTLGLIYVLLLPPLMVGISMLGSFIPGLQAARLPIVSVLRNE